MDEYFKAIQALPETLAKELASLNQSIAPFVQEIRLRVGQPIQFTIKGKLTPCGKYLPGARQASCVESTLLQACFLKLCRHSAYAYEEELRQGFLTIPDGNRVGVAGEWGIDGFLSVTALNLRVARWVTCELPSALVEQLAAPRGGILVAGPPGSGKTTLLRTMVQHLGRGDAIVCVVDERAELLAGADGKALYKRGIRCDSYTRCPKAQAVMMALRCMNPQIIVCDELGGSGDAAALEQGVASGVCFLASVHCDTPENLYKKPQLTRLLQTGAFDTAVFLDGRERAGTVARVVELA